MEKYIKHYCRLKRGIPIIYGNRDVWPWIEKIFSTNGFEIEQVDDTIIQNIKGEMLEVTLIKFKAPIDNVLIQLSNVIDDTKISLPWLDTQNVYASHKNYKDVKEQVRINKLTSHILEVVDFDIRWIHSQTVKLIRFDCDVPDDLKQTMKLNPNLSSVNISFAYPWHQFWYITESLNIDRLVLDACANYWISNQILGCFDLIDLVQIQIAFRGSIENHYLYRHVNRLIEQKIDIKSSKFNINTHLFDCNKPNVDNDTILYLIYQYGRYFKKIIWLHDFKGSSLFDNCVRELNKEIINRYTVELDLKMYTHLSANELISRVRGSSPHFNFTIKISDYNQFTGDLFVSLIKMASVKEIHFNVAYHLNFFTTPENFLDADEVSAGCGDEPKTIWLTYKSCSTLEPYNGLKDFVCFFKRVINSEYQQKFFYLIIDGIIIENWLIFAELNIISIRFDNIDLNIKNLEELSECRNVSSVLEFHDCANLNDTLLMRLITTSQNVFSRIKITGNSSITSLFFYMRAELRLNETNSFEYDFANETPVIEMDQYDRISVAKYYINDDRIECYDDYYYSDDEENSFNTF